VSKRLFVGNLSFDISEDELRQAFEPYGATVAEIPGRNSGRKGFGFVEVADEQARTAIEEMTGKDMAGRAIEVTEAKPRQPVGDAGGRGYGGRGGYGGNRGGYGGDRGGDRGGGGRW
jgi:RNA recognition motif-containing protein